MAAITWWVPALCAVAALGHLTRASEWNLVLAHSNDILTHLDQITDDYKQCSGQREDPGKCYGGVARHLWMANKLKADAEKENHVFLHLNAGSMLGGSVWFPVLGIDPVVQSTAQLKYNAVGLGYRDFDEGITSASQYLQGLKQNGVKILCANANFSREASFQGLVEPSLVYQARGNVKIGIIGFLGADADTLADTGKIQFTDEVSAIQREIQRLKQNENVNFFIALGSAGFTKGKEILEKTPELDILVNGGSNTFLYKGDSPSEFDTKVGEYPYTAGSNRNKILVQVPRYGKYLGVLKAKILDDGRVQEVLQSSNPLRLDNEEDPMLKHNVSQWASKVTEEAQRVVGKTLVPLVSARETCWVKECNAAALITDAALWFLNTNVSNNQWEEAVAAVVWHGGALARTNLTIAAGEITYGNILAMFPFANTLAYMKLRGDIVKKLFETSVEFFNDPNTKSSGEFLHVAGARVEYDLSHPKGSRVVSILIRDPSSSSSDLVLLDESQTYKIGMPSFIARGGSRYGFLEDIAHIDTGIRDEDVLDDYISFMKVISVGTENRVAFITQKICQEDQTGAVFLTIFLTLLFSALIYWCWAYGYPKLRERSGSLTNLIR